MIFTRADLGRVFSSQKITSAEMAIHQAMLPNVQREGEVISSMVQAGRGKPSRVYIRVLTVGETLEFRGECSCGGGKNCRHVLIVLLAALEAESATQSPPSCPRQVPATSFNPAVSRIKLLYVLHIPQAGTLLREIRLTLFSARSLEAGGFGRTTLFRLSPQVLRRPPGFLSTNDLHILSTLSSAENSHSLAKDLILNEDNGELFRQIISTQCCFLNEPSGEPLSLGVPHRATHFWQLDDTGNQFYALRYEPDEATLFIASSAYYIDVAGCSCGELQIPLPIAITKDLLDQPPIEPEALDCVKQTLLLRYPDAILPALEQLTVERVTDVVPIPHLWLYQDQSAQNPDKKPEFAQLGFQYEALLLNKGSGKRLRKGQKVWDIERNLEQETQFCKQLEWTTSLRLSTKTGGQRIRLPSDPNRRQHFLLIDLPRLRSDGWLVEIDPALGLSLVEADTWYGDLNSSESRAQFTLDMGAVINGEEICLLPALVDLITSLPTVFSTAGLDKLDDNATINAPLSDGRLLPIPVSRLKQILQTLLELYESDSLNSKGRLVINRWQAAGLAELGDEKELQWHGEEELVALVSRLRSIDKIPAVAPPEALNAELRPYQQRGLDWLQFLREYRFGGILADDMGLGKTVQTLAHIQLEKQQGRLQTPCLIVAPTSLLFNWRKEAEKFTPELNTLVLHGADRHSKFPTIPQHQLIITSYGLMLRDELIHSQHNYHLLVLDEAQVIKNPAAKISRAARQISAAHKLCLSGTPMENHLGELWSLFDFLMPGFLGNQKRFGRLFRQPIEKQGDEKRSKSLSRRIQPYLLRRTKSLVAGELPPRTEILRMVNLEGDQRELYESVRLLMQKRVREVIAENGMAGSKITILDALLKLRQACCDPRLVKLKSATDVVESAKLSLLMEMLPEMIEEGRRILLFSQFTSMLELIQARVSELGITYVTLTGKTQNRAAVVEKFQNGAVPLFLISLKAGGVGLNLTAADTVIHYDPWWNPAVEEQATGRAHRIGQENPVFVYKLIVEGTVEEKIHQMQQRKKSLSDAIFAGKAGFDPQWGEEDLENLFQPLG